ncbi:MAG: hypothetical protein ACLP9L_10420 [Thermoguttaceae bacterium]
MSKEPQHTPATATTSAAPGQPTASASGAGDPAAQENQAAGADMGPGTRSTMDGCRVRQRCPSRAILDQPGSRGPDGR